MLDKSVVIKFLKVKEEDLESKEVQTLVRDLSHPRIDEAIKIDN